ncbi:hypothetical protein WA556_004229, partial [Blastocystis sp. ATCC 50177/Nand II]
MLASRSFASACAMRVERCPALSLLSCGEGVCGGDVYDGNKVEEVMMHDGSEDKEGVMMHDGNEDKEEVMMHDGSEDKEVMMHDGNEDKTAMNANDSKTATNDGNDDTTTAKILTLKQLPSLRWFSAGEKAFSHVECAELKNLPSLSEKCIKLSESSFASLKRVVCETNCILQRVLIEKCAFW